MDFNEIDPLWNYADAFTVTDAAVLIAGFDPSKLVRTDNLDPEKHEAERRVSIVFSALTNAISARKFKARLCYDVEPRYTAGIDNLEERGRWGGEDVAEVKDWDGTGYVITPVPNWAKTTIERQALIDWLKSRGTSSGFFFPNATSNAPDYLDPNNSRYAPKLAAAVRAWQSVTDPGKRTPKQALEKWLREHAAEFGLTDDDGNAVNKAMEECSTVANWKTGGGAPTFPG